MCDPSLLTLHISQRTIVIKYCKILSDVLIGSLYFYYMSKTILFICLKGIVINCRYFRHNSYMSLVIP